MRRRPARDREAHLLAAFLVGAGALHVGAPSFFDSMIPRALPGPPRAWTLGSAAVEIATGTAVAVPATRRHGGLVAALLFVAVFPGNVTMAWRARRSTSAVHRWAMFLRLPLQAPLVAWGLRVRRGA